MGPASQTPIIVVSTCAREVSYLLQTVTSLDRAGAAAVRRKFILVDGTDLPLSSHLRLPPGWEVGIDAAPKPASSRNNLWAAFRIGGANECSRLLFFEDDVIACKNAVARMASVEIPERAAWMTFHDVKEMDPDSPHGVTVVDPHGRDGLGLWGLQALAVPKRTCEYLAKCDPFAVWKSNPHRFGDRTLEHYTAISPWPGYAIHVPCLVQHVGAVSKVEPGKPLDYRKTSNWRGDDYDALEGAENPFV